MSFLLGVGVGAFTTLLLVGFFLPTVDKERGGK